MLESLLFLFVSAGIAAIEHLGHSAVCSDGSKGFSSKLFSSVSLRPEFFNRDKQSALKAGPRCLCRIPMEEITSLLTFGLVEEASC